MTRSLLGRLKARAKHRFFAWIARNLPGYAAAPYQAVVAPSAIIGPTGTLENNRGDLACITVGEHCVVKGRLLTYGHGGKIVVGEWSYIGERTEVWSMDSITIGNRVMISHGCDIHDGTAHSKDPAERHAHFRAILETGHPKEALPGVLSAPVVIEDDVWINQNVTILRGVRIGARSIIAAGSIVLCDVPPRSLYRCQVTPIITPLGDEREEESTGEQ